MVITGAGGGFGDALTRQLIRAGAHLILTSRQPERLQRVREAAEAVGGPGRVLGWVAADLSSDEGCAQLHAGCLELTPHVDLLINNAGIGLYGPLHAIPQTEWERLIQVNLLAPLRLTARFLPAMMSRRSGHVVLMSSIFGLYGLPGVSPYAVTKFGLRGLGESLAEDMRDHGVDVSVIYPFFTRTEILESPQYGVSSKLPDWIVDDTEQVMARTLAGIARRRRHIYPSLRAHSYALASRFIPWVLPTVSRLIIG
ncbi:MAG: SDR family NAD(P)-dependent oxidoreductase [Oscillochloris sp.]|nr:SDR family NAD(P)-dependent oxidoreductase [Oscillochloris sp.]